MSKGKSEKYLSMESLANSLREERNQMFREVERLRDEIGGFKKSREYVYVVMSTDGNCISVHLNHENAVDKIKEQNESVKNLINIKDIQDTSYDERVNMFYLLIRQLED